jgi:hypothetical protein
MRRKVQVLHNENPSNGSRDTVDMVCGVRVENARYEISGKRLQRKPRYSGKDTLFSKKSFPNYIPMASKLTFFIAHAWRARGISSRKIPPVENEIQPKTYVVL